MMRFDAGSRVIEIDRGGRASRLLAPAIAEVRACLKGRHDRASAVASVSPRARRLARSMRATSSAGNFIFGAIAPGEDDECRESADQGDNDQPPDLPDHAEAGEGREESADKAGRAVSRHLDWLVDRFGRRARSALGKALGAPIIVYALDLRQDGEIEHRRGRRRRPFERAAHPGVAGHIAQLLAIANAEDELGDLTQDAGQNDRRAQMPQPEARDAIPARRNVASAGSCP